VDIRRPRGVGGGHRWAGGPERHEIGVDPVYVGGEECPHRFYTGSTPVLHRSGQVGFPLVLCGIRGLVPSTEPEANDTVAK
jgi:hypothetical protein